MIKEAMEYFKESSRVTILDHEGGRFVIDSLGNIEQIEKGVHVQKAIKIYTLAGLVEYLKTEESFCLEDIFVHIKGPCSVLAFSKWDYKETGERAEYAEAVVIHSFFQFNKWYDIESMIIKLQAMFVMDENIASLVKMLSGVKDQADTELQDNGVSQQVTVKTGITTLERASVPNPITLKPYRTFLDVEQPEGKFIFRLKKDNSGEVIASLWEAECGLWNLEAIDNIKAYFKDCLPEAIVIG